jgi:hypothetical protein
LMSLNELGITSISLSTSPVNETVAGNQVVEQSSITINGTTHDISEVNFATSTVNTIYTPPAGFSYAPDALNLPDLDGYGRLPSLQVSMSENSALLADVRNFVLGAGAMTGAEFDAGFQALLFEWAGVSGIDPTSRGDYVNAQQLAFVYAFYGIDQVAQPEYAINPGSERGPEWEADYTSIFDELELRFASQIGLALFTAGLDVNSFVANPLTVFSKSSGIQRPIRPQSIWILCSNRSYRVLRPIQRLRRAIMI